MVFKYNKVHYFVPLWMLALATLFCINALAVNKHVDPI